MLCAAIRSDYGQNAVGHGPFRFRRKPGFRLSWILVAYDFDLKVLRYHFLANGRTIRKRKYNFDIATHDPEIKAALGIGSCVWRNFSNQDRLRAVTPRSTINLARLACCGQSTARCFVQASYPM